MFSRLDSIFKTPDRQTEKVDTRLAIRRKEQDQRRSKDEDRKKSSDEDLWTDSTSLSLSALQSFLENLLHEQGKEEETNTAEKVDTNGLPSQSASEPPSSPPPVRNVRAAQAYQRTKETSYPEQAIHPQSLKSAEHTEDGGSDLVLTTEEKKVMRDILSDLKDLSSQGYTEIKLEKADNLLQGIMNSIQTLKKGRS